MYHSDTGPGCEESSRCVTVYSWAPGQPCVGANLSNTMESLLPWLGDATSAAFVAHDAARGCDVWRRVPLTPEEEDYNETACAAVVSSRPATAAPVYDDWRMHEAGIYVHTTYDAFAPTAAGAFPEHAFRVPSHCPVTTSASRSARRVQWS